MRYLYLEFLGMDDTGNKQHLVFDFQDRCEKIISQSELENDKPKGVGNEQIHRG